MKRHRRVIDSPSARRANSSLTTGPLAGSGRSRPGLQAPVAGRRLGSQVHAARDGVRASRVPVRPDPVKVVLGEREHDAQHKTAGVGGEVEPVLDGDERPAGGLDAVDQRQAVDQRAPEAVEHRHHHAL